MKPRPSEAFLNDIFATGERIDVGKRGTQTTRRPIHVAGSSRVVYACGGHEATCLNLLEYLRLLGVVKRWKSQPFNLLELGGPDAVPDVLAQLPSGAAEVIQVRAWRFLTPEVQEKYAREREFLQPLGFGFHIWTNHDVLSSDTSHTVAELARGRLYPAARERIEEIRAAAEHAEHLGTLLDQFGWDDALSAAAHLAFHFDITQPIHEHTQLLRGHSATRYVHLFAGRHAPSGWWESLAPANV